MNGQQSVARVRVLILGSMWDQRIKFLGHFFYLVIYVKFVHLLTQTKSDRKAWTRSIITSRTCLISRFHFIIGCISERRSWWHFFRCQCFVPVTVTSSWWLSSRIIARYQMIHCCYGYSLERLVSLTSDFCHLLQVFLKNSVLQGFWENILRKLKSQNDIFFG